MASLKLPITSLAFKFSEKIQTEHFTATKQNGMPYFNGEVGQMGGDTRDGGNTEKINWFFSILYHY